MFDALLRLANAPAALLRARLPAEATRMGFPDIHWNAYFDSANGEDDKPEPDETVAQSLAQIIAESVDRQ